MSPLPFRNRRRTLKQWFLTLFLALTAPGVVMHELSHALICIWQRIPIGEIVYFQFGSPAGYVQHGQPRSWTQAFLLAVAPLFINVFIASWLFIVALNVLSGGLKILLLGVFLSWLGSAALIHSLPSPQDIKNLWNYTTNHVIRYPLLIIVGPLYAIILLVYKTGMYYVSIPLTVAIIAGLVWLLQVDPLAVVDCVQQARWGCWSSHSIIEIFMDNL